MGKKSKKGSGSQGPSAGQVKTVPLRKAAAIVWRAKWEATKKPENQTARLPDLPPFTETTIREWAIDPVYMSSHTRDASASARLSKQTLADILDVIRYPPSPSVQEWTLQMLVLMSGNYETAQTLAKLNINEVLREILAKNPEGANMNVLEMAFVLTGVLFDILKDSEYWEVADSLLVQTFTVNDNYLIIIEDILAVADIDQQFYCVSHLLAEAADRVGTLEFGMSLLSRGSIVKFLAGSMYRATKIKDWTALEESSFEVQLPKLAVCILIFCIGLVQDGCSYCQKEVCPDMKRERDYVTLFISMGIGESCIHLVNMGPPAGTGSIPTDLRYKGFLLMAAMMGSHAEYRSLVLEYFDYVGVHLLELFLNGWKDASYYGPDPLNFVQGLSTLLFSFVSSEGYVEGKWAGTKELCTRLHQVLIEQKAFRGALVAMALSFHKSECEDLMKSEVMPYILAGQGPLLIHFTLVTIRNICMHRPDLLLDEGTWKRADQALVDEYNIMIHEDHGEEIVKLLPTRGSESGYAVLNSAEAILKFLLKIARDECVPMEDRFECSYALLNAMRDEKLCRRLLEVVVSMEEDKDTATSQKCIDGALGTVVELAQSIVTSFSTIEPHQALGDYHMDVNPLALVDIALIMMDSRFIEVDGDEFRDKAMLAPFFREVEHFNKVATGELPSDERRLRLVMKTMSREEYSLMETSEEKGRDGAERPMKADASGNQRSSHVKQTKAGNDKKVMDAKNSLEAMLKSRKATYADLASFLRVTASLAFTEYLLDD